VWEFLRAKVEMPTPCKLPEQQIAQTNRDVDMDQSIIKSIKENIHSGCCDCCGAEDETLHK
jgi:hypothetical protein